MSVLDQLPKPLIGLASLYRPDLWRRVVISAAILGLTWILTKLIRVVGGFWRVHQAVKPIPEAPGRNWLLGHVIPMLQAPKHGKGAWDLIEEWTQQLGPVCRFRVLNTYSVVVSDPASLKRIFQTKFKSYAKDLGLSYHPFLPILGTGLVTSDGDLWQKQRLLIGPALRVDILDDIVGIAKRSTDRLTRKLETMAGSGKSVGIEEEFRLLTLQVIGEAILSLPAEECDRVSSTCSI